jgi:N-ethylmaleimide reductase
MNETLFSPFILGSIPLQNRIVMAPMTRNRALGNTPNDRMARYYGDRATAGLIITEGVAPSPNGLGYPRIPGLFSLEQVAGWRKVTSAVHQKGGKIFVQLMHTGRVGHADNLPAGARVLAPSSVALTGEIWTDTHGTQPHPTPVAMSESDIEKTLNEYVQSAQLAIEAGFDGVEIHGANGYLVDQFLNTASNQRTDTWGGTIQGRIRFAAEVASRISAAIGAHRVGMRLSPYGVFNGMQPDAETDTLYLELVKRLDLLKIAYIHLVDHSSMGAPAVKAELKATLRGAFHGTYILSGGYDAHRAKADLLENKGDLVAFGRPFISNPSLVEKLKTGATLNPPDFTTFYTPGEEGYNDYAP